MGCWQGMRQPEKRESRPLLGNGRFFSGCVGWVVVGAAGTHAGFWGLGTACVAKPHTLHRLRLLMSNKNINAHVV